MDRIEALKSRAQAINLAWTPLVRAAGADPANFQKWQAGRNPTIRVFEASCAAVDDLLAAEERTVLRALASRLLPAELAGEVAASLNSEAGSLKPEEREAAA